MLSVDRRGLGVKNWYDDLILDLWVREAVIYSLLAA